MSCDNETQYWRVIQKYTTIPGVVPSIPSSQDHNDGTWNDTDLYIGELFMNTFDNRVWYRSLDGIHEIGATISGTGSFVGDYVPTTGGTFSGTVFGPTFSANGIIATLITASAFDGTQFGSTGSTYYGDGSNLTGITVAWNGGTVSNPTEFQMPVYFGSDIVANGPITTDGPYINVQNDLWIAGIASASAFVGDGSGLTNLPTGTYSDTYTIAAGLSGSTIIFDRNDLSAAYYVDIAPILSTYSITSLYWDSTISELTIQTEAGDTFTETINEFDSVSVLNSVSANDFYGGNFYGSFNGTFSGTIDGDIYTTSATLVGTTAVFDRTDGVTYSLDLSTLSGGGSGSVGPTGPAGATGADGATPYMFINYNSTGLTLATGTVTLPITTTIYIGWTTGTRLRLWNDSTHYMEGVVTTAMTYPQSANIDVLIDYVVGTGTPAVWRVGIAGEIGVGATASGGATQSLAQTLTYGNTTGANNIILATGSAITNEAGTNGYTFVENGDYFPKIYTNAGTNTNWITVEDSETWIRNQQINPGFTDRYGEIIMDSAQILSSVGDNISGSLTAITQKKDEISISGTDPVFAGIQYLNDYSANFTGLSLVTKDWVQSEITLGITDTYGTRTDKVYADASPGMRTGIVSDDATAATGSVVVDPDGAYISALDNDYNSTIEVTNEVISIKAGSTNLATEYTEWQMALGVFYKNFVSTTIIPGADDKLQLLERSQSWTFDADSPGNITLFYDNYVVGAIMDYEIDFFIRSQSASGKLMTYKIRKNGSYDGGNTFYPILPTDTQKGTDPSYDNGSWDIQILGSVIGDRYEFYWDAAFCDGYTYTITAHIKTKQKKY